MFVSNWMSRNLITIGPATVIPNVIELMRRHRIRTLPVLEGEMLIGLVSDRDVREYLPSKATELEAHELRYLIERTAVSDVMTRNPIVVDPETPIEHAAILMRRHKIGSLPVVKEGKLVGILTQSDVFEAMVELLGEQEFGARITLDIGGSATALKTVFQILEEFAPHVVSAVSFSREDLPTSRGLILKMRLGESGTETLLRRFEADGIGVIDARLGARMLHRQSANGLRAAAESHQALGNSIV